MNVSILPIEAPDTEARWRAFSGKIPRLPAFSSYQYARRLSETLGYECLAALVESSTSDDAAGAWLFSSKKGPFSRVIVPPFTAYTPILTASSSYEAVDRLIDVITTRFDDVRLHLHPRNADVGPFEKRDWLTETLYTYCIDIGTIDADFRSWSAGPRRTFRKHSSAYRFQEEPQAARDVIALCMESYRRHNRPFPAPPDQLEKLANRLQNEQMIRIFTVAPAGENDISGGIIALVDGFEASYWIAGSIPGPSMTVLIGRSLLELQTSGYKRFDFIGANTPSIAEFKRRFGAILTPYAAVSHCPNKWLAFGKAVKKILP